jgi:hypothetical protein
LKYLKILWNKNMLDVRFGLTNTYDQYIKKI